MTSLRTAFCAVALALSFAASAGQPTVCIDPGHPSEVGRGTAGKHISEMKLVWQIANKLAARLRADGYRAVLTKRSERQFVTNRARAGSANNTHADLMVRLHCDASSGSGFTVYYPDRQGRSHGVTGPSKKLLARIKQIAARFHLAFARTVSGNLTDNGLRSDAMTAVGRKQGALTGSIFSTVPVVLIEMVVLTNPKDERFALSARGSKLLVNALVAGVEAAVPNTARRTAPREAAGPRPHYLSLSPDVSREPCAAAGQVRFELSRTPENTGTWRAVIPSPTKAPEQLTIVHCAAGLSLRRLGGGAEEQHAPAATFWCAK